MEKPLPHKECTNGKYHSKFGQRNLGLCMYANMYYTLHLEVYIGEQPDDLSRTSNSPFTLVKRLCHPTPR